MLKPSIDDSPIIRVILSNIPQRMAVPAKIGGASFKTNGRQLLHELIWLFSTAFVAGFIMGKVLTCY